VGVAQRGASNSIEALQSAPFLWLLFIAGFAGIVIVFRRERPLFWYSVLAVLFLAAFLVRNPFVYPYNFVILIPVASPLLLGLRAVKPEPAAIIALLIYAVAAGFFGARRMLGERNAEQVRFVDWMWRSTEASEGVFDWQGMHFGRRGVNHWFVYGANADLYRHGWYSVADELERANVTMILPNYRFDWLTPADRNFIDGHYLFIGRCVMSPGVAMRASGSFDIVVPGVYAIVPPGSEIAVDGSAARDRIMLGRGAHSLQTQRGVALLYTTPRREAAGPPPCPAGPLIYNF